jgi:hypothetical protein
MRVILYGGPFSGHSHRSAQLDRQLRLMLPADSSLLSLSTQGGTSWAVASSVLPRSWLIFKSRSKRFARAAKMDPNSGRARQVRMPG